MFKKNLFLLCAFASVYAPIAAVASESMCEDDATKGSNKKCCNCCSLTVKNNAVIGGNLTVGGNETVGGSITAASFISSATGLPIAGLRNWAIFSNASAIETPGTTATVPWDAASVFAPKGITNNAGEITLPTSGIFAVLYTVRFTIETTVIEEARAFLRQSTTTGGGGMTQINGAAVISNITAFTFAPNGFVQTQLTGYALITVTSAANNVIDFQITLPAQGYLVIAAESTQDANAQIAIFQLN